MSMEHSPFEENDILLQYAQHIGSQHYCTATTSPKSVGGIDNDVTSEIERAGKDIIRGAETVEIRPGTDELYAFPEDGTLRRIRYHGAGTTTDIETVMHIGGRVLGFSFASQDVMYACDVHRGLLRINLKSLSITVAATKADDSGQSVLYCDDVAAASDGNVYFTDAMNIQPSQDRTGLWNTYLLSKIDYFRGYGTGRLLQYDTTRNRTTTLLSSLYFANGIALSHDGSFVVVAETFNCRLIRYWVSGPARGRSELFAELPGMPDGVRSTASGSFWVAIPALPNTIMLLSAKIPLLRTLVGNLPPSLWPRVRDYGLVLKLLEDGAPAGALHDALGLNVRFVTAVTEHDGVLYLGQLKGNSILALPLRQLQQATAAGNDDGY
jgi:sugar lactone lactonase YvrE